MIFFCMHLPVCGGNASLRPRAADFNTFPVPLCNVLRHLCEMWTQTLLRPRGYAAFGSKRAPFIPVKYPCTVFPPLVRQKEQKKEVMFWLWLEALLASCLLSSVGRLPMGSTAPSPSGCPEPTAELQSILTISLWPGVPSAAIYLDYQELTTLHIGTIVLVVKPNNPSPLHVLYLKSIYLLSQRKTWMLF